MAEVGAGAGVSVSSFPNGCFSYHPPAKTQCSQVSEECGKFLRSLSENGGARGREGCRVTGGRVLACMQGGILSTRCLLRTKHACTLCLLTCMPLPASLRACMALPASPHVDVVLPASLPVDVAVPDAGGWGVGVERQGSSLVLLLTAVLCPCPPALPPSPRLTCARPQISSRAPPRVCGPHWRP